MEINVRVEGDDAIQNAEVLKKFLDSRPMEGISGVEMSRTAHGEGEQGLGSFLGGLVVKLTGSDTVITEFIKLLEKFVEMYNRPIKFPNGVEIPTRGLTPEQRLQIIQELKKQS